MRRMVLSTVIGLVGITVWEGIRLFDIGNIFFMPSALQILSALQEIAAEGLLLSAAASTGTRVLFAFILTVITATPLGICLGMNKKLYEGLSIYIDFFRSLPATALFPLFILLLGIGDISKVFSAAFAGFFILLFNVAQGALHLNKKRVLAAKLMGATPVQIFFQIVFFETLPQIMTGLRTSLSVSLVIIIVSEMLVGASQGIGYYVFAAQITYRIPEMYAWILVAGIFGYAVNASLGAIERRVVHWTGR